jgi:branched-chain amino acid transport system substrate-binding protein
MKHIKKLTSFLKKLDVFQILSVPLLLLILFFSLDFKTPTYKIGIVLPLTGEYATRSQSHLNGIILALEHINELGGINEKKIVPITKDCGVAQEKAVETTRDLIYNQNVMAIFGGFSPANTRAIQAVTERAGIPFITGICTHFEITNTGSDYSFRTITDDRRQFEALAEYANKKHNVVRPAIIYDEELYGADSAKKYAEIAIRFGQEILQAVPCKRGSLNFRKPLDTVFMGKPDALVILASAYDSALLVRQAREARYDKLILGANQFSSNEFMRFCGIYSEGVVSTLPFNTRVGGQKSEYFTNEYAEKYGQNPDADAAMGYESIMVMALALRASGDGAKALKDALASTHGWESIVGTGGFDKDGNQVRPAEIAIVKEKQLIPISMESLF